MDKQIYKLTKTQALFCAICKGNHYHVSINKEEKKLVVECINCHTSGFFDLSSLVVMSGKLLGRSLKKED